jgi:TP901 family phage tail tape measure protein
MAGALKTTVEIILKGTDLASDAFKSANKSAGDMAGSVKNATQPMADLTQSLWKVQAGVTAAGLGMIGFATSTAIDAESAVVELSKVMSKTENEEFSKYSNKLGEIADKYASTKTQATLMAAEFRQSGFTADESMGLVSDALKLVAVSELDASQATEVFIKQLKGSKQPAQETSRLIDILNYSSNNSGSSIGLLGDTMARTAATFKATGFTWEEQAALLEPLTTTYQRAELASSAFNTGLQRIGSTNKIVLSALDNMGIALKDSVTGEATTAKYRFEEMLKEFPKLSEAQQLITAQEIFGVEQASKMLGILGERESVQKNIAKLQKEAAGSADEEFKIFAEAAQFQLDQVTASFKNLSGEIGGKFLDSVKNSFGGMSTLLQAIKKEVNNGTFDEIFTGISSNFDGFADALNKAAENLPNALAKVDFSGLVESFNGVFDSLYALFGFDLGTEQGLADAIQFLVDSVKTLNNVVSGSYDALKPFVDEFKKWVTEFNKSGKESQTAVGEMLGMLTAVNKIAGAVETFSGVLGSLAGALEALAIGKLVTSLTGGGGLVAGLKSAAEGTKNLITKLGDASLKGGEFFKSLSGKSVGQLSKSFGLLAGKLALYSAAAYGGYQAGKKLGGWIDRNAPALGKKLHSLGDSVGGWLGGIAGDLRNDGDSPEEAFAGVALQVEKLEKILGRSINNWEDYKKAIADLTEINKKNGKQVGNTAESVKKLDGELRKTTDTNNLNVKSNEHLQSSIQKSGEDVDELKEKITNFNKQAKIESVKAGEVFDFANNTIEFQIDSSLEAFKILTDKTRNITSEQKSNLSNFINQSSEQTKAINKAQIGLLETITDQKRAQTDLIRNMTEFGLVRVEASEFEPELTTIFNSIFKKSKIQMLGAAQIPTVYGDNT